MKVTDARLADFVGRKLGIRSCEACGMSLWEHDTTLYELRQFGRSEAGMHIPLIRLTCGKCGNTKLFDAVTAGLTDVSGDPLA